MTSPTSRVNARAQSTGTRKAADAKSAGKPKAASKPKAAGAKPGGAKPVGTSKVSTPKSSTSKSSTSRASTAKSSTAKSSASDGTLIDAFSDADGIWTTVPIPATVAGAPSGFETGDIDVLAVVTDPQSSVPKSVPSGSGWQAGEAWAVRVDATLPPRLGALLGGARVTPRMAALATLVACVTELLDSCNFVPTVEQSEWRWLPTPDPLQAVEIDEAGRCLVAAGFFRDATDPGSAVQQLVVVLLNGIAPIAAAPGEARPTTPGEAWPATPGEAWPATPGDATPTSHGDARPTAPDEAWPTAPGDATPTAPDEATPTTRPTRAQAAASRRWQPWARQVATRRASNARLVLRLDVPDDLVVADPSVLSVPGQVEPAAGARPDGAASPRLEPSAAGAQASASTPAPSRWTLTPIAEALDDPTTRFPVIDAGGIQWPLAASQNRAGAGAGAASQNSAGVGAGAASPDSAGAGAGGAPGAGADGPIAVDAAESAVGAGAQATGPFQATFSDWTASELAALRRAWPKGPFTKLRPTRLSADEALELLDSRVDDLAGQGIEVIMPSGLLRPTAVRRRVSAAAAAGQGLLGAGDLQLRAEFTVDGVVLTDDEVSALVLAKAELVSVRGHWIRVDDSERAALARLLRLTESPITLSQLLAEDALGGAEWRSGPHDGLQRLHTAAPTEPSPLVKATLRHYQRAGLDWLTWIESNRTGGILADDMGLGKTLQVLARIAADHAGPTLVVCPVTLVDTWLRQAAQFTPELRIRAHHGSERRDSEIAEGADIVVTTYGVLSRDEVVRATGWHRVVLDEAQAVKNPDTRVARAARALTATHRLAVTGTPVENHVGDLWSLMAFAMPGLLPARATFRRRFGQAAPDSTELQLLRDVTAPFLLRRLKSDPAILPDLPERVVVRDDCALTKEQIGAYEAVARQLLESLADEGGQSGGEGAQSPRGAQPGAGGTQARDGGAAIARRATVLAAIGRLKQVCVHPALLSENHRRLRGRSGKVDRLTNLCAEIIDEGQAVVVFTQFASFVPDLADHLHDQLGVEIATLVGAHSRARRAATVDAFAAADGPPVLVASIKAGGTGLTLTRANHVVHLDRWWNPAVEDQASDRVWRIGQQRNVVVHTLVCPGTLEERIDAMLSAKRGIADAVVRSTDTAVTELSTHELAELVTLSRDRTLR